MRVSAGILHPDSNSFLISAEAILSGDLLTHDPFKTPMYSMFLAAFMAAGATPRMGTLVIGVQHLLGLISTAIFFGIARRVFSLWVAVVSSLVFSAHALLLFYETSVLSETLFVFLLAVVLDQVTRILTQRLALWRFAVVGALAGMATLTRPVALWFILPIGISVAMSERASGRAVRAVVLVMGVYVLTLLPWMYVNKQSYGFWGVSLGQGLGLFMRVFDVDKQTPIEGTSFPAVEQAITATNRGNAYAVRNELNFRLGFSASGSDRQMLGYAFANVRAHPFSFFRHSATNWIEQMVLANEDVQLCRAREGPYLCNVRSTDMSTSIFPNAPPPGNRQLKRTVTAWFTNGYLRMWIVAPLAFVGMGYDLLRRTDNRPKGPGVLLIAAILYFSGVPALINWPEERFRLPIDALLFMFACVGAGAIWSSGRRLQRTTRRSIERSSFSASATRSAFRASALSDSTSSDRGTVIEAGSATRE